MTPENSLITSFIGQNHLYICFEILYSINFTIHPTLKTLRNVLKKKLRITCVSPNPPQEWVTQCFTRQWYKQSKRKSLKSKRTEKYSFHTLLKMQNQLKPNDTNLSKEDAQLLLEGVVCAISWYILANHGVWQKEGIHHD